MVAQPAPFPAVLFRLTQLYASFAHRFFYRAQFYYIESRAKRSEEFAPAIKFGVSGRF
jgi:hypothetical protein